MRWVELIGYLGSILMFSTFYMKTMIPLRLVGMAANVCMIVYTAINGIYPVLILQTCLLPLNAYRLIQMKRLIVRVTEAARGEFKVQALIPFMTPERFTKGATLFREGDPSNKMYLVQTGSIRLLGIDKVVSKGELIGEIGVLSPSGERTATALCLEDTEVYSITQDQVLQLYYQNPEFGFFLLRLVTKRLLANIDDAQFDMMATLGPGTRRQTPP